ncbi:hypothetical protein Tco_0336711 [Tanacetum coccineum]
MEAQYGKFLDMIRSVRINVPLVDVLAGMPNYGKFLRVLGTVVPLGSCRSQKFSKSGATSAKWRTFDRLADKQSGRPSGSLPSNTQPNPKGHNSKTYQPPQSRNEHVNAVFTRSGKSYNPPVNPNDQQNDSENTINFDSDDEDEEPTPQPKTQNPKPVKETPLP